MLKTMGNIVDDVLYKEDRVDCDRYLDALRVEGWVVACRYERGKAYIKVSRELGEEELVWEGSTVAAEEGIFSVLRAFA